MVRVRDPYGTGSVDYPSTIQFVRTAPHRRQDGSQYRYRVRSVLVVVATGWVEPPFSLVRCLTPPFVDAVQVKVSIQRRLDSWPRPTRL